MPAGSPSLVGRAPGNYDCDGRNYDGKITPVSYSGNFIGVGDGIHDAQGDAYTVPLEDGSDILRLENFKSTNGPDLYVYLATDDDASEFINLVNSKQTFKNYDIH